MTKPAPRWARSWPRMPGAKAAAHDEGVTLVELLVVMVIASIVGGIILTTIILISNLVAKTTERTEEFIDAKMALDEITTNVRGAFNQEQGLGRLAAANSRAMVFYTKSGKGLTQPPVLMGYFVDKHDQLIQVISADGQNFKEGDKKRIVIPGIQDPDIFTYYTWADTSKTGQCFRKLTHTELTKPVAGSGTNKDKDGLFARNAIAGVKISLTVNKPGNIRFTDTQTHKTWVRLADSVEPKDPVTGALIPGWPEQCWTVIDSESEG